MHRVQGDRLLLGVRATLEGAGLALPGFHHGLGKGPETTHGIGASEIQKQVNIGQRPLGVAMVSLL